MTANQLALASLRESTRHNTAGEEETNRHNVRTEEIDAERNRINELATNLQDERERQRIQYDKDLKEAQLAYEYAALDEKEWYEQKIVDLKEAEQNYEAKYKEDMARIESRRNDLNEQSIANDLAYKQAWKEVQLLNAELESKKIEYEATLKREQIESNERIQHSINALTEWRDTANYILSMQHNAQNWSDLRRQQEELDLKQEQQPYVLESYKASTSEAKSRTFRNYWESIFHAINETVENGFRIFDKYLGGTQYGTAKKAAEALFSD